VRCNGAVLSSEKDYSIRSDTKGIYVCTIKKEVFHQLPVGDYLITFDMSGGMDPVLTVTVEQEP
jgi:hypothetical protein